MTSDCFYATANGSQAKQYIQNAYVLVCLSNTIFWYSDNHHLQSQKIIKLAVVCHHLCSVCSDIIVCGLF